MKPMLRLLALLFTGAGCVAEFEGASPPAPADIKTPDDEAPVDCSTGPGLSPLRRLPARLYQNTVRDVLQASGLASLTPALETRLDAVPADSTLTFTSLDARLSPQHLSAYFSVATAVGDVVESTASARSALLGTSCVSSSPLNQPCLDAFSSGFARRVLRRPPTAQERATLSAFNDRPGPEAARAMVVWLLMSPAFLNQLEVDGAPATNSTTLLLTPFELASRLAAMLWQSTPDDALLDAAESGSLMTEVGYRAQVDRLFADPRTRQTLRRFWREWLKLDAFQGFSEGRPAFRSLTQGLTFNASTWPDMVAEVEGLTEHYTFTSPAGLDQLLTSNVSLSRSAVLAQIYGVPVWSGQGTPPGFAPGTRAGLLQRAALLVSGQEQTNPFHRGAVMRRVVLCDALPQPDPAQLPPGSLDPPASSPMLTTRQRYEAKVAGNGLCQGCHGNFSDLGYVQETFDAIGRRRERERVFDEQTGALVAELPLDTRAVPKVRFDDVQPVNDATELNARIVESGRMATCLVRAWSTSSSRREPSTGADRCAESRLATEVRAGRPLAEVFKSLAFEPWFRMRTVGPQ